jgi:hypothetical protein
MKLSLSALLLGLLALGLTPANAWGQTGVMTPYSLDASSRLERGSVGPCEGAAFFSKLTGSFDLRALPPDPLYTRYAIEHVEFLASEVGHALRIIGSGTYRVGGAIEPTERMTLNLSVEGGPVQRFDSGDVHSGGDFPRITIPVRLHEASACTDTILTIVASPGGMVGIEPRDGVACRAAPTPLKRTALERPPYCTATTVRFVTVPGPPAHGSD